VAGISHAMMAEHYALPGQLVVGTDSHTPHSGALGCVAFGVGTTDMANAFVTGAVRSRAAVLRVVLDGALPAGVTAKDVVLHLLRAAGFIRAGGGVGKVFEFGGRGHCGAGHRRARHAHQHDGRTRRPHRHRRARRGDRALPARAPRRRLRARAVDAQRPEGAAYAR
jgi:hypothetical protein